MENSSRGTKCPFALLLWTCGSFRGRFDTCVYVSTFPSSPFFFLEVPLGSEPLVLAARSVARFVPVAATTVFALVTATRPDWLTPHRAVAVRGPVFATRVVFRVVISSRYRGSNSTVTITVAVPRHFAILFCGRLRSEL